MRRRILIVEDEALLAFELKAIVEGAGFFCAGMAADMESALELADGSNVDIAILDLRLAHGDCGLETAKLLREEFGVKVLFICGSISDKVRAFAAPLQPLGYIEKPFEEEAVLDVLQGDDRLV